PKLFNRASQVVLVRDADKTVLTMANDFQGDPKEFAIVIPVPTFIERGQIHVGEKALIDHLDAYSAPRLVEYFDENPCTPRPVPMPMAAASAGGGGGGGQRAPGSLRGQIQGARTVCEGDNLTFSPPGGRGLQKRVLSDRAP